MAATSGPGISLYSEQISFAIAGAAAVSRLKANGQKVSLLIVKTLYPVPEKIIKQALAGKSRVVVVEMNLYKGRIL